MPIPQDARVDIKLTDPRDHAKVADAVEAWGFRTSQERGEAISRRETAGLWLENEYRPVVAMLREAELIGARTSTEAYLRVSDQRYRLLRTHRWGQQIIQRVIEAGGRRRTRRRR